MDKSEKTIKSWSKALKYSEKAAKALLEDDDCEIPSYNSSIRESLRIAIKNLVWSLGSYSDEEALKRYKDVIFNEGFYQGNGVPPTTEECIEYGKRKARESD